jgi:hypothetical protein
MSYDPVATLAAFADEHGITYPLLSDEGSEVIERLGLLNEHIEEMQAHAGRPVEPKHHGLPYPGTFVLSEDGVVIDKHFEVSHRVRPSGLSLLEDLGGGDLVERAVVDEACSDGVRVAAWLGSAHYREMQIQRVHLTVDIPEDLHVYGEPIADGYVPLTFELGPEGSVTPTGKPELPEPAPFRVEGLDERFVVHRGRLEVALPFRVEAQVTDVEVTLTARFQACTDTVCHPPAALTLRLPQTARNP